jgi:hypothetical protein
MANPSHKVAPRHGLYTAMIGGHSWSRGPRAELRTIRECRAWAEEYGATADYCSIYNAKGVLVGQHSRDTSGSGNRWFRDCWF